jgi:hypothetical protein
VVMVVTGEEEEEENGEYIGLGYFRCSGFF